MFMTYVYDLTAKSYEKLEFCLKYTPLHQNLRVTLQIPDTRELKTFINKHPNLYFFNGEKVK